MKYKVGDRVRVRADLVSGKRYGIDTVVASMLPHRGKVVTISKADGKYKLAEDSCKWNWTDEMFEGLAHDHQKIVITTDGKTTLARLYDDKNVVKSAEAKCSPEDTFDFMTGAKIALERLNAPEEKKHEIKAGMFVRVKGGEGRSHFIADGQICEVTRLDNGFGGGYIWVRGYCTHVKCISEQILRPEEYELI